MKAFDAFLLKHPMKGAWLVGAGIILGSWSLIWLATLAH